MNELLKTVSAMVAGAGVVLGLTQFHYDTQRPAAEVRLQSTEVHFYGVVRKESSGWALLNNATHIPQGLTNVECESDGELRVEFQAPLETVGTASVSPDEGYAGKVAMGPSVGLSAIYITFRINGTTVHCNSAALNISNSNAFIDVWGNVSP